jgi:hypothetical protein
VLWQWAQGVTVACLQRSSADVSSHINGDMADHEPRCMSRACLAGLQFLSLLLVDISWVLSMLQLWIT